MPPTVMIFENATVLVLVGMVQHMLIFDWALVEVKKDKAGMYVPKTKPKQSSFFG